MRDGITLAKAGHPAVVLVYDNFERAARAQAKALGMPDLRIYVYPQYQPGDPLPPEAAKAVKAAEEVPALLERAG
ncbi:MAG: hypothetical protein HYY79_09560 [Betaproteobacteria bacterium]|nr:hypothetical protein [Betaproteobacteria bacterium]